jgi:hypothetical protein
LVAYGLNFTTTRNMINGTSIAYAVKQPTFMELTTPSAQPSVAAVFEPSERLNASAAFLASGGPRTVTLCFETTVDQNTVVATYTDMVVVSVGF